MTPGPKDTPRWLSAATFLIWAILHSWPNLLLIDSLAEHCRLLSSSRMPASGAWPAAQQALTPSLH